MVSKNNIIDITVRRQQQIEKEGNRRNSRVQAAAPIVDLTERRQEVLNQERRLTKRTILTEFVGVFVVVPQHGLKRVSLYDISETGLAFDVDEHLGGYQVFEEVAVRVYISQHSYFPFTIKISNVRSIPEEGVVRHGANFIASHNDEALFHFVKFIETVSYSLQKDEGDLIAPSARR